MRLTEVCLFNSQVYEVRAHVHWLWHFHASLYDAASDICMEEYHLCAQRHRQTISPRFKQLIHSEKWVIESCECVNKYVRAHLHTAVGQ